MTLVCRACDYEVDAELARLDARYWKRTIKGRSGRYDDWVPDEFVMVCPVCGAVDRYDEREDDDGL